MHAVRLVGHIEINIHRPHGPRVLAARDMIATLLGNGLFLVSQLKREILEELREDGPDLHLREVLANAITRRMCERRKSTRVRIPRRVDLVVPELPNQNQKQ